MSKKITAFVVVLSALLSQPALSQTRLAPKAASGSRVDTCAPIGRTANGQLVYSMKCDNLPAPPPPPPQARIEEPAPPPPPETPRGGGGIFGWSFDRRPSE